MQAPGVLIITADTGNLKLTALNQINYCNPSSQPISFLSDNCQAQPSAGYVCDNGAGGKSLLEDEWEQLLFHLFFRFLFRDGALLDIHISEPFDVDSGSIVGY